MIGIFALGVTFLPSAKGYATDQQTVERFHEQLQRGITPEVADVVAYTKAATALYSPEEFDVTPLIQATEEMSPDELEQLAQSLDIFMKTVGDDVFIRNTVHFISAYARSKGVKQKLESGEDACNESAMISGELLSLLVSMQTAGVIVQQPRDVYDAHRRNYQVYCWKPDETPLTETAIEIFLQEVRWAQHFSKGTDEEPSLGVASFYFYFLAELRLGLTFTEQDLREYFER